MAGAEKHTHHAPQKAAKHSVGKAARHPHIDGHKNLIEHGFLLIRVKKRALFTAKHR
jgi:hypothetical protein